jgi:hypothetical protein
MMRREWDVKYQREVVAIRTALACPTGTTPYLQNKQVMDDVINVYPAFWQLAVNLDRVSQETRRFDTPFRRDSSLNNRLPLRLFRIFVRLGRQDITGDRAIDEINRA